MLLLFTTLGIILRIAVFHRQFTIRILFGVAFWVRFWIACGLLGNFFIPSNDFFRIFFFYYFFD